MSRYVERIVTEIVNDGFLERVYETVKISLKKCPFCGGKARLDHTYSEDFGGDAQVVRCEDCGARTADCGTTEEAADLWNARA